MKTLKRWTLAVMLNLTLAAFAHDVSADTTQPFQRGLIELSLQSGLSWTNLNYGPFWFKDNPAVAPLFQISGMYEVTPWLSMGAEIGLPTEHKVNTKNKLVGTATEASESKRTITQFTPEIQIGPWLGK